MNENEVNEYGVELDECGYSPSIIVAPQNRCYYCGSRKNLQRHEIFNAASRKKSKRLGLWVLLCSACHYDITFVHAESRIKLKAVGQKAAMTHYGWTTEEFIETFGKNYRE